MGSLNPQMPLKYLFKVSQFCYSAYEDSIHPITSQEYKVIQVETGKKKDCPYFYPILKIPKALDKIN